MNSIFFTHQAVGLNGEKITVYKFRSMRGEISLQRDATISLSGKLDNTDKERVTFIGKIIGPIGLDELPQIYNLLILNNMQIIGIRPFLIEEFKLLPQDLKDQLIEQKPGIIPAEAFYDYELGNLDSRIEAIRKYIYNDPKGFKKLWIGIISLIKRWLKYSTR